MLRKKTNKNPIVMMTIIIQLAASEYTYVYVCTLYFSFVSYSHTRRFQTNVYVLFFLRCICHLFFFLPCAYSLFVWRGRPVSANTKHTNYGLNYISMCICVRVCCSMHTKKHLASKKKNRTRDIR